MSLPALLAILPRRLADRVRRARRRRFRRRNPRPRGCAGKRETPTATGRDRGDDRAALGGQPRLADLLDHDPLLGLSAPRSRRSGPRLLAPLTVALLAIVLRSAALGLRASPGTRARAQRHAEPAVRSWRAWWRRSRSASVAGGLAAVSQFHGAPARRTAPRRSRGRAPFALVVGALAVALCAQLAASFVAPRPGPRRRAADSPSAFDVRGLSVRRRASWCSTLAALPTRSRRARPALWHRLIGAGATARDQSGSRAGRSLSLARARRRAVPASPAARAMLTRRGACCGAGS